ncbi:MAG: DUF1552 domain-containing protein [Myxococcales bacterium]|nr:DUF1552 domain-containing protein [Myxococcales bacterium]
MSTLRRHVHRRRFLRGLGGIALGLPFLESLVPKLARGQMLTQPKRFVLFFECNGVNMDRFWPSAYGTLTPGSFGANQALYPIRDYADRLLIPRGIHMVPKGFGWDGTAGCDHSMGMGQKLTATNLQDTEDLYASGISVDQEMAKSINPGGRSPLNLRVGPHRRGVLGSISYTGPGQPAIAENNPYLAYQDFMGVANDSATSQMMAENLRRRSVLDLVADDFEQLKRAGISKADQDKLDMHFSAVREVEQAMGSAGLIGCNLPTDVTSQLMAIDPDNVAYDSEFKTIGRLQMQVMALAIACDYTRVATLQLGNGSGGPIYTWDGMNHQYNHHKLSHGNTRDDDSGDAVAGYLDMIYEIDRWHAGEFKYLLDLLDAYDEGGSSVLDNSAVVWANELSDGKDHDFRDLPFVIAGSCGGYFRTGEYIKVTNQDNTRNDADAPHNKLLTTFLNAVGARKPDDSPYTNFGDYGDSGIYTQLVR